MRLARRLVPVFVAIALVAAAGAEAQEPGAGDEQYQDPFGGQTSTAPRDLDPDAVPSPESPPPPLSPSVPTGAGGAGAGRPPNELPRTGFDAVGVGVLGLGLLLAGLALRRRAADAR